MEKLEKFIKVRPEPFWFATNHFWNLMRHLCNGYSKKDLGLVGAKDNTPTVRGCISTSHVNCTRMVCRG